MRAILLAMLAVFPASAGGGPQLFVTYDASDAAARPGAAAGEATELRERRGWQVVLPAGLEEQAADIHLAVKDAVVLLEARIEGEQGAIYADPYLTSRGGPFSWRVRVNFRATATGRRLVFRCTVMNDLAEGAGQVMLRGVELRQARGNRPPSVRMTRPARRAVYEPNSPVILEAAATDPDGQVERVEFYGFTVSKMLGAAGIPPFRIELKAPQAPNGYYWARAYDNHGRAADSPVVFYTTRLGSETGGAVTRPLLSGFPGPATPQLPEVGAPTVVELPNGDLLAAWYAGRAELTEDQAIWGARLKKGERKWQPARMLLDTPNLPDGNPVLFCFAGKLWCFYSKVHGHTWEFARLCYRTSEDSGASWSAETELPAPSARYPTGTLASIKPLVLSERELLLPLNREAYDPDPARQWWSLFLKSADAGKTWTETAPLFSMPGNIQPTVIEREGTLFALFRVRGLKRNLWESVSRDRGETWAALEQTNIRNPSARVDMVKLKSGRVALAFNDSSEARSPLCLALSEDGGRTFPIRKAIESGPRIYTYPAMIQASDGRIHVVYNDGYLAIKHAMVDEDWFRR